MKTFARIISALVLAAFLGATAVFAQTPTAVKGYTKKLKNGKTVAVKGYSRAAKDPKATQVKGYTKTLKNGKTVNVKGYSRKSPMMKKPMMKSPMTPGINPGAKM